MKVSEKKVATSAKKLPSSNASIVKSGIVAKLRFSVSETVGRSVWNRLKSASALIATATRISIILSTGLCFKKLSPP